MRWKSPYHWGISMAEYTAYIKNRDIFAEPIKELILEKWGKSLGDYYEI